MGLLLMCVKFFAFSLKILVKNLVLGRALALSLSNLVIKLLCYFYTFIIHLQPSSSVLV